MIRAAVLFAVILASSLALRAAYMAGKGVWLGMTCYQTDTLWVGSQWPVN